MAEHRADVDPGEVGWDAWYDQPSGSRWSGRPNGALVAEVADLPPGRALDVGCGEGGDAIWLAQRGWRVTGLDPSQVALERAVVAARAAGVAATWVCAGLLDVPDGAGEHDLVTAFYAVLPRSDAAVAALAGAVAPGGTLLVVHHEGFPAFEGHAHGQHGRGAEDLLAPGDVAARLRDGWVVEVHEVRERPGHVPGDGPGAGPGGGSAPAGRAHPDDVVLRARRPTGA